MHACLRAPLASARSVAHAHCYLLPLRPTRSLCRLACAAANAPCGHKKQTFVFKTNAPRSPDAEYVVEAVLDEVQLPAGKGKRGKEVMVLVKWQVRPDAPRRRP